MKKWLILLIGVLILVGCSAEAESKLIHEDIQSDTNQLLEVMDQANEDGRELTNDELELLDEYKYKYYVGSFTDSNNKEYEMNDVEKELVREVYSLYLYVDDKESLSSENSGYELFKERVTELLSMKKIPEDLKDKYPTYQEQKLFVHESFLEDAEEVLDFLNRAYENPNVSDTFILDHFMTLYDQEYLDIKGEKYAHNKYSEEILQQISIIHYDIYERNKINLHRIEDLAEMIEGVKQ